jgi:ATP-dependent Clp protease ATP-binding subunit ClpA
MLKHGFTKQEFISHWQKNYKQDAVKVTDTQAQEILEEYCVELTALADKNKLEPLIGRSGELDEMITVLARRFKANVLLVGEPGCGKCLGSEEIVRVEIDISTLSEEQLLQLQEFEI